MLQLGVFILLFAWAEHFTGGGFGWDSLCKGRLPGRPLYYTIPFVTGVPYLLSHDWRWALLGFLWTLYRSPAWKLFGGRYDPVTAGDGLRYGLRHALAAVVPVAALILHMHALRGLVAVVPYTLAAVALGFFLHAEREDRTDVTAVTEVIRGALFGGVFYLTVVPV